MESGVYLIKNILNNKVYVGSSSNVNKRWTGHKHLLNKGTHNNSHLRNAWHKYGENNFEFSVIEYMEMKDLIVREQYYIDAYSAFDKNKGYNLVPNAGSNLGWKPSKITRNRMSESAKKKPPISEKTRKKLSEARKGNKNGCRIVGDEERKMMSNIRQGINRGEKNGMSICDKNEIIAMRSDYDNGMSISEIMIKYDKKNSFTYQIVKRLRWKWLDD